MATAALSDKIALGEELRRNNIVIRTYNLWKTYIMGDQEIHAVSGVEFGSRKPGAAFKHVSDHAVGNPYLQAAFIQNEVYIVRAYFHGTRLSKSFAQSVHIRRKIPEPEA